jgi:hypothetical protein
MIKPTSTFASILKQGNTTRATNSDPRYFNLVGLQQAIEEKLGKTYLQNMVAALDEMHKPAGKGMDYRSTITWQCYYWKEKPTST